MELFLVKGLDNRFTVAYETDYEKLKKIKAGKMVKCVITQPRNLKLHRKFFSLISLVFANQEHYSNIEHLRHDLIIAAGFYDERVSFHGEVVIEPKSISFANMSEDEFQELYSKVVDAIVQYFHFDKQDILDNVAQFY